jgi:hypothetical protein
VRALAYYIIHRYTIEKEAFPDPNNKKAWNMAPLFPGNRSTEPISYQQMRKVLSGDFEVLNFEFSKVTHIFRVAGARFLDEQGIDEYVSNVLLFWLCICYWLCILQEPAYHSCDCIIWRYKKIALSSSHV